MKKSQKIKKSLLKKITKILFIIFGVSLIVGISGTFLVFSYFSRILPDPGKLEQRKVSESTKIYDRTGNVLLYEIHGEEKRTIVSNEQISQYLKDAIIATEDSTFYTHEGFNLKRIAKAFYSNLLEGRIIQGGSTITQQLVKNLILTSEKTFSRKIKEILLAYKIENKYSKEDILGIYLNQIPFGSNTYGVEAAGQTFFGKKAKDLSLAESALLASLIKAPTFYSPYGHNKERTISRQQYILQRMLDLKFITKENYEKAKEEKLNFLSPKSDIKAPHFVMYIRSYLIDKYGEDFVEKSGLSVYTTLDFELQEIAEKLVEKYGKINEKEYNAKNASLAAIDPKTGQVLVMVGSRDYFNIENEGNFNTTIALRQPGSSFKPFAYAALFQKEGFSDKTYLFDLKTQFNPLCNLENNPKVDYIKQKSCYEPGNYDDKFRGPITLREALAQSLNIPAVKVLHLAGIPETIKLAEDLGISTLKNKDNYGLSLVLGGAEVKLLDMVSAYGVFSQQGKLNPQSSILRVVDSKGNIIESFKSLSKQVLSPKISVMINSILSDNAARTPVFGEKNLLHFEDREVAAKTGTTQEYKDAWVIGYSPNFVSGVWVGNNRNKPMKKGGAGIRAAGPLWHDFMVVALKKYPKESFIKPSAFDWTLPTTPMLNGSFEEENIIKIDKISGKLANQFTPEEFIENKIYKRAHNILYYLNKNDPQFENWEIPVSIWEKDPKRKEEGRIYGEESIKEEDNIHTEASKPIINIISPQNESVLINLSFKVEAGISYTFPLKQVDFFFDNILVGSSKGFLNKTSYSFDYFLEKEDFDRTVAVHQIKVKAYDTMGNKNETSVNVTINNLNNSILPPVELLPIEIQNQ